jgi:DNA alkylation damage repair protein AlkB
MVTYREGRPGSLWDQERDDVGAERVDLAPGAVWFKRALSHETQQALAARCLDLINGDTPAYVPTVRGGGKMHVRMLCLGRHWNGTTYQYEHLRSDFDHRPAPPIPEAFVELATDMAARVEMTIAPDVCIVNYYDREGRMGLHQDRDEGDASLDAGVPVVSVSIGDTARFLFGGTRRRDEVVPIMLTSGDVFVFGGPARLRYHGVSRVLHGTAPGSLGFSGRLNLTFRQY